MRQKERSQNAIKQEIYRIFSELYEHIPAGWQVWKVSGRSSTNGRYWREWGFTRPDCITKEYLDSFKEDFWRISGEDLYGIWTSDINYKTLNKIDRGHTLTEYLDAVLMTAPYGFEICTHIILNLPGDDMTDVIETAKILSALPVQIVKLHSLYIPKGSKCMRSIKKEK